MAPLAFGRDDTLSGRRPLQSQADLVILGAGPAGLGAALRTARAGHDVVVLERESHVGGAAASIEVAGVRVDLGSHRLHPATPPAVLATLRDLLGDDLQRRARRGRIRLAGRWLRFPLSPTDLLRRLPPSTVAGIAVDGLLAPWRRPRRDTFAEQVRAGLGPTLLDHFYAPYARKLWGLGPEEISGEQARRRIPTRSVAAAAARLLRPSSRGGWFHYPRRGFGQISEALADAASDTGARIELGTAATGLHATDDGVAVETADGTVHARRCWSTIPLPVLARLWTPTPPDVRAAASSLTTRAMVLVYLVLGVPRYTRFDAHYLPEGFTPVTRISEPKNYRDAVGTDPTDRTVLCAELPCAVGDTWWNADDDTLAVLVTDALRRAELPDPVVVGAAVHRLPSVYPVYRRGYETAFARLDAWASSLPGVLTFGRQGLFVHDNSHHALAMAWAAADALGADGAFDAAAWSRARTRFATHVVED